MALAGKGKPVGAMVESKECYFAAYVVDGIPTSQHLKFRKVSFSVSGDSIPESYVAVEMFLISVDPYVRTRMTNREEGLYFPPFELNQVVTEFGIGRVIASRNDKFAEGDIVMNLSFLLRSIVSLHRISLRELISVLLAYHCMNTSVASDLNVCNMITGVPGFTAWVGIEVLGDLKPGSNVFISAAAGGVGMYAGQLAKLKGCRVIGSTGSDEKVKLIKEEFGYDDGFNYNKETDFDAALSKYFPDGIDFYFDNVGGKMLEAALNHVSPRARIPLCGMISQYNKVCAERYGVRNLLNMVRKEVRMEGFMMRSHLNRFDEFVKDMENYAKQGKIRSKHVIYNGIESYVESLGSLFSSSNAGKVIVKVR